MAEAPLIDRDEVVRDMLEKRYRGAVPVTDEMVQAVTYTTTISSTATPAYSTVNGNTSSDSITVSGTGLGLSNSNGNGPTSNTLTWDLYFQATPATPGTCAGTTWSGSPLATGTINVTVAALPGL